MKFCFTLSWYLVRSFTKWLGIITCIVVAIIILFDMSELIRRASSRPDISLTILFKLMVLRIPHLFQKIFSFVVLFSSILTFWHFNKAQEITVFRSLGISVWQIIRPIILMIWFIGGIDLMIFNPIASKMITHYEYLNNKYFRGIIENLTLSESGFWIREQQDNIQQVIHIHYVRPEIKELYHISIYQYDAQDIFTKRIFAKAGKFKKGSIILEDVWAQGPDSYPVKYHELKIPTLISFKTLQNINISPESISFWQLLQTAYLLEKSGLSGSKYKLAWHALLAKWSLLGIMVLLAASYSLHPVRQRRSSIIIGVGGASAFFLYFLQDLTYALGNSGNLPIIVAAWGPIGLFFLLSITVLLYFEEG